MRDNRNISWLWVDNALVDREDLNIYEKMLYVCLARHAGQKDYAFPSLETLRKELGLKDTRTVVKYIRTLNEKGLIHIEKINGKNNKYYLNNIEPPTYDVPTSDDTTHTGCTLPPTPDVTTPPTWDVPLNKIINKKINKDDVPLDEESINRAKKLSELRKIVALSTGLSPIQVDGVIKPYIYKDIDLIILLEKIKQSDFLMGKCSNKPTIAHFTQLNMLNKILADYYKNKVTPTEQPASKDPSRKRLW